MVDERMEMDNGVVPSRTLARWAKPPTQAPQPQPTSHLFLDRLAHHRHELVRLRHLLLPVHHHPIDGPREEAARWQAAEEVARDEDARAVVLPGPCMSAAAAPNTRHVRVMRQLPWSHGLMSVAAAIHRGRDECGVHEWRAAVFFRCLAVPCPWPPGATQGSPASAHRASQTRKGTRRWMRAASRGGGVRPPRCQQRMCCSTACPSSEPLTHTGIGQVRRDFDARLGRRGNQPDCP
mmetsp:Transcript_63682/g.170497  ORF Transcript_63682/g.170497 Transcript_63682/m.170497 type:complete len:236 (-) Transcript_63682:438-1145(-)